MSVQQPPYAACASGACQRQSPPTYFPQLLRVALPCRFSQALNRVKQPLFALSRHADPEIALVGLCHVGLLVQRAPYAFSDDYQQFFVRHSDAAYVKQKKVDVLKHLATDSNQMVLVHELMEYTKVRVCGFSGW